MKKLVIFDLDGTLLNTIEDLGQAANYALELGGYATHSMASYPYFVGNGVRRLMTRVLPEDARDDETVDRVLGDFLKHYDEHCTDYTKHYNGMPELLQDLRDMGVGIAVASNKYQKAVDKIITHFFPDIPFIAVEGHREGVNVKPDPSVLFAILAKAGVAKADCLYVGDSGVDMEAGRRACIDTVGVTWGFRSKKELVEYYADAIVNNPIDILDIVENGIKIS